MLAAGTAAQASFSAIGIGLPVLAPALRERYDLTLGEIGIVLAAEWAGTLVTLLPWGFAADRFGERWVLAAGLGGCGLTLASIPLVERLWPLVALLMLAGGLGAGVAAASGRAVMHWFGPDERGLALGVRQTAIPAGGLVAAVVLPHLSVDGAFLFLGAFCLAGAITGAIVVREGVLERFEPDEVPWTLRDRHLWVLCFGSGLYLVAQVAVIGFAVLYLHDERGLSKGAAAGTLAGAQVGAVVLRIGVGRWSDLIRSRLVPLRRIGIMICAATAAAAALLGAPLALLVPVLVAAGALSMAWNGLAFTAAAEFAGRGRSGAAIGFQQSVLSAMGVGVPIAFAATVSALSWQAAYALAALFPLAGAAVLRSLRRGST